MSGSAIIDFCMMIAFPMMVECRRREQIGEMSVKLRKNPPV